ncbi:MAG: LysM peptidoglycan-binding domain-containing protein [Spirochaetes bacterium]|nr:LysM peptidoglycan-binding domain-containing protein [Spirochaetota bacterium]
MKVVKIIAYLFCGGAFLFSIVACGEKVPIREMADAKVAISKAESVKADRYAFEEITAARKGLMESHSFVMKDDQENAAKQANAARIKAEEAYTKAVPLLAKDSISTAEKSLEEATDAYAENLARFEYQKAVDGIKDANKKFEDKDFYNAHLTASAADVEAKKARDIALGKKGILGNSIADVNATIDRAKKYNALTYAPEQLKLAEENVSIASDSLAKLHLKQGFAAIEVAKINADEALVRAMKGSSDAAIKEAQMYLDKAEKSPNVASAGTDLALARESLKSAQEFHQRAKYDDAITAASDSKRLSLLVINARSQDIAKAGVGEKEKTTKEIKKSQREIDLERGYTIYVVRYIPERRDCLWRIAEKYYGDGKKWSMIHEANKELIQNPHLIYPGWRLKVPLEGGAHKKVQGEKESGCDQPKDAERTTPVE